MATLTVYIFYFFVSLYDKEKKFAVNYNYSECKKKKTPLEVKNSEEIYYYDMQKKQTSRDDKIVFIYKYFCYYLRSFLKYRTVGYVRHNKY